MSRANDRVFWSAQRRDTRFPTQISAVLTFQDRQATAVIEDISCHGFRIAAATLPRVGSRLTIRALGLDVSGMVVWIEAGRCGVQLDKSIDPLAVVRENLPQFRDMRARASARPN